MGKKLIPKIYGKKSKKLLKRRSKKQSKKRFKMREKASEKIDGRCGSKRATIFDDFGQSVDNFEELC